jgi:hypothetical protein
MSVLLLQMAHAEDVEDLVGLDGALPEAAAVEPVPLLDAGEGASVIPASAAAGEEPTPALVPTGEATPKVATEPVAAPAAEDPATMAGIPPQVAE